MVGYCCGLIDGLLSTEGSHKQKPSVARLIKQTGRETHNLQIFVEK